MAFALCPDQGPPRLWRFVASGELPEGVVSTLDEKQNILRVDKDKFEQLCELDRHMLLRTHAAVEYYR